MECHPHTRQRIASGAKGVVKTIQMSAPLVTEQARCSLSSRRKNVSGVRVPEWRWIEYATDPHDVFAAGDVDVRTGTCCES